MLRKCVRKCSKVLRRTLRKSSEDFYRKSFAFLRKIIEIFLEKSQKLFEECF